VRARARPLGVTERAPNRTEEAASTPRLAVLLAAAMFVFVIDTSLMNVSISAVVRDLDTTVSGVQAAVAIEALVSAAFILIGSKVGDLFGRKRAYVVGLVLYAAGALAMVVGQGLTAERRAAREAAGRSARGDPRRDHQHQHRRPAPCSPGRTADHSARRAHRPVQRLQHGAPAGSQTIGRRRGDAALLRSRRSVMPSRARRRLMV
jgi:Major Facilitator Superfamily